jgi:anthranilate phosphoribosyltransferase
LKGERGPRRDIVALNAGAAIMVAGLAGDLAAGIRRAEQAMDAGAAQRALQELIRITNGSPNGER